VNTYEDLQLVLEQLILDEDLPGLRRLREDLLLLRTPRASATAELVVGLVASFEGRYASAMEHYHRALEQFVSVGDRGGQARAQLNIGLDLMITGDHAAALETSHKALSIYKDLNDAAGEARCLGNIGRAYAETGDFPTALDHFYRAISLYEAAGMTLNATSMLLNVGAVYIYAGDYAEAELRLTSCLDVLQQLDNKPAICRTFSNLGELAQRQGEYEKALGYLTAALGLAEEFGDNESVSEGVIAVLGILVRLERLEEALALASRTTSEQFTSPTHLIEYHKALARLAMLQGDLDRAYRLLHDALAIAHGTGLRQPEHDVHVLLRDIAQIRNDFASFISHNASAQKILDEIQGRDATQKIAILEAERRMSREREDRERERALLYGALPQTVADRMLSGEDVSSDHFEEVSVLFLDIVGFTAISDRVPPGHVVHLLKAIFRVCDEVCRTHGLTKIKTIGDSYMAVAGVPEPLADHAREAALAAVSMMRGLNDLELKMDPDLGDTSWTRDVGEIQVRIGLHCGPVVAGIVGDERLQYDVWGDTVNTASRMESTGEPGRIQVSESFAQGLGYKGEGRSEEGMPAALAPRPYSIAPRGAIEIKGKGSMTTYWLEGA